MPSKANKAKADNGALLFSGSMVTITIIVALIFIAACQSSVNSMSAKIGSGKIISESRKLKDFHSVVFEGRGSLYLSQSETPGVIVEIDDNLMKKYKTKVEDGVLRIGFKKGQLASPTQVVVRLSVQQLRNLVLNGSGRVVGMNTLTGDDFHLVINGSGDASLKTFVSRVRVQTNGSGDANLQVHADDIEVASSGSGRVRLSGRALVQRAMISGSGDYLAAGLQTQSTRLRIAGSGDARLWVDKQLAADLQGSGTLYYKGSPEIRHKLTGSGQIRNIR